MQVPTVRPPVPNFSTGSLSAGSAIEQAARAAQADGFIEIDALAGALDADTQMRGTLIGDSARAPDIVIMGSHDIALDVVRG